MLQRGIEWLKEDMKLLKIASLRGPVNIDFEKKCDSQGLNLNFRTLKDCTSSFVTNW